MRLVRLLLLVAAACCVSACSGAPVTSLPGLEGPLPFNMSSGYLTVDAASGRKIFYTFVASQSDDPAAPLVPSFSGGPGCSSTGVAMMQELGPVTPDGSGGLRLRPYGWQRFANVLFLDIPCGAGFSYSQTAGDYDQNINTTSEDAYTALGMWLALPENAAMRARDLYFWGESFAGDYVLQLLSRVVHGTVYPALRSQVRGIVLGNPTMTCESWQSIASIEQAKMYFYRGLVPRSAYAAYLAACPATVSPSSACEEQFNTLVAMAGPMNPDSVYADLATGNSTLGVGPSGPDLGAALHEYMNDPAVQKALHAEPTEFHACCAETGQSGAQCRLNFTNNWAMMRPYWETAFAVRPRLRVLVYSGDLDVGTVPMTYSQVCLPDMGASPSGEWRPWTLDGQVAGYTQQYDGAGPVLYATIKGAAHEAPLTSPRQAYALVSAFLAGREPGDE